MAKTKQGQIDFLQREIECYKQDIREYQKQIAEMQSAYKEWNLVRDAVHGLSAAPLVDVVRALVADYHKFLDLVCRNKTAAKNRLRDAEALCNALRFIGDASCPQSGSSYLSSDVLFISIDQIMRKACERIGALMAGDRGLINGNQDSWIADEIGKLKGGTDDDEAAREAAGGAR